IVVQKRHRRLRHLELKKPGRKLVKTGLIASRVARRCRESARTHPRQYIFKQRAMRGGFQGKSTDCGRRSRTTTTTTIAPPGGRVVLVPAATSFGPSFRHANMNIASEKISPLHTAFRPRQRRADMPPIARWDPRAAKFLAIRASQPPVSSRAACARYRLGRKTADRHNALMRRFDRLRRDLTELNTTILRLYDTHTILPPSILANVIHDVERASSLYRTLRAAAAVDIIPEDISLPSTLLHGSLKPSTPPCVPSSTPVDFFGG
ncbi:hypothetical protein B0H16DRAFT_831817, partial [Mycena metata]